MIDYMMIIIVFTHVCCNSFIYLYVRMYVNAYCMQVV